MFSYNKPSVNKSDILKINKVLKPTWITQGSQVAASEKFYKNVFSLPIYFDVFMIGKNS